MLDERLDWAARKAAAAAAADDSDDDDGSADDKRARKKARKKALKREAKKLAKKIIAKKKKKEKRQRRRREEADEECDEVRAAMGFGASRRRPARPSRTTGRARRAAARGRGGAIRLRSVNVSVVCLEFRGNPHDHQMWLAVWLTTDHLHGWLCTCAVHTIRVKIALSSERMRNCDR